MDAVFIRMVELPISVKGITVRDSEGDYNIYINILISEDERAKAFRHEIQHIREGHFFTEAHVGLLEKLTGK